MLGIDRNINLIISILASLVAQMVKNLPAMRVTQIQSLGWEDHPEKGMVPTPLFLPEEFHEQRSLAGYRPWGHKDSDTTEQLTHAHTHIRDFFSTKDTVGEV